MKRFIVLMVLIFMGNGCSLIHQSKQPERSGKESIVNYKDKDNLFSLTAKETEIFRNLPDDSDQKWIIPNISINSVNNSIYVQLIHNDIPIKTGDIVLRLTDNMKSFAVAITSLSGYSHCGIILEEDGNLFVVDIHPDDDKEKNSIRKSALKDWVKDDDTTKIIHALVLRPKEKIDKSTMTLKLNDYLSRNIEFDYDFQFNNNKKDKNLYYCAELIYEILQEVSETKWETLQAEEIVRTVGSKVVDIVNIRANQSDLRINKFRNLLVSYGGNNDKTKKGLITPASFAFSSNLERIGYVTSKYINNYSKSMYLYKRTEKKYLALMSLHAKSTSIPDETIKESFLNKGLSEKDLNQIMYVIKSYKGEFYNSDTLIYNMMKLYAENDMTYEYIYYCLQEI